MFYWRRWLPPSRVRKPLLLELAGSETIDLLLKDACAIFPGAQMSLSGKGGLAVSAFRSARFGREVTLMECRVLHSEQHSRCHTARPFGSLQ